jgi:diguanylate cyclase (GGDEF)-like protein/PAS domain S-box-containing protein
MKLFVQSLQSRLALLIILVALPGLIIPIFLSVQERDNAINAALQQAVTTVDTITAEQAQVIEGTRGFLKRLSTFKALLKPESSECSLFLSNTLKLNDTYVNLGVPQLDGNLLCNASPLNKPVNVADRPYIRHAIATEDFSIGEFQVDRAAGVTSINFAYPVIHPLSGKLVSLAVAVVSLDWWSKRLLDSRLPENSVAYITDHKRQIIAIYPTNSKHLGADIESVQSRLFESQAFLTQKTKIIKSDDGHLRIFVNKRLLNTNNSPITVSVGIPFGAALSVINSQLIETVTILIFFVILMFLIATWGIRKSVLNPLNALLRSTKKLELGKNIDNTVQQGSSELIDLQQHFASMATIRLNAEKQLISSQASLQESEQRLSRHIENTPLGCISWDRNFQCTEWNKSAEKIFGYSAKEAIGCHASDLIIAPSLRDKINRIFSALLEQKGGGKVTNENTTKNNRKIICEWHNTPIKTSDGRVTGVASLVQDVTERKQLEEKLTLAASVFSHAREGIIITDAKGVIIDVNETFTEVTGYERDEVLGQNPRILQSERQSSFFYEQLWQSLINRGHWHGEIWNKRKNQEVYPQLLTISAVRDDANMVKNYVALFTDITQIKEHQGQLEYIAHYDLITKLPNRTLLADRLRLAIAQCKRHKQSLAVVFLDLDGFKYVNDNHGHALGDELLVVLSQRMKEALRGGDTLSRFGGDEFVVVLTDLEKEPDYEPILGRLLKAASEAVTVNETVIKVSASIGVTLYPQDNVDAEQLIRHADQAMYVAKQKGKNCFHLFDTISDDAIKIRRESLQQISVALEKREFVLYYQPKINMQTCAIIGVEALIRWSHPERGLLPPKDFLPVIENHAVSIDIGEWVLEESLTQMAKWQRMGLDMSVSVNIDALQLQQPNFTEKLASILAEHSDVAPSALQLEVLETSALGDVLEVSNIMHNCLKLGVSFALDDFGTGYSSLTYLRRLPADLIKIDQTFIRDMQEDPEDLAIVSGIVGLAKSFNRQVIAEGVETIEHGVTLMQLGCDLAQGYVIAKPMPAENIPDWAANWQPDPAWRLMQREIGSD